MQQGAPDSERGVPGKSATGKSGAGKATATRQRPSARPESIETDEEEFPRVGRVQRFDDAPPRPWWRPASRTGKVFLGLAALAVLGAFTACVVMTRNYLDRDSRFRIEGSENIEATGLAEVSRSEMLPVFGEDIGRNVFFVPLKERRKQLEQIPWVESATVMRFFPDRIRVAIVERQPIAFVRQGQQIGLVDASGVLLAMPARMMAQHHYSFPVVTGIDARDPLPGRRARMAVYQRLLGELDSGGQKLSEQISEIDLTDPADARVLMPEQGGDVLAHFGEDHFLARYQRYKAHIAEWRGQYPKLAAVDLRYEQQVVLQMTPGAGGVEKAAVSDAPGAVATATTGDIAAAKKPAAGQPMASPSASGAVAGSQTKPAHVEAKKAVVSHDKKMTAAQRAKKKREEQRRAALARQKLHSATG
jgi:cell division protein FtsQ